MALFDRNAVRPSGRRSTANGAGGVAICLSTLRAATSTTASPAVGAAGAPGAGAGAPFAAPASATNSFFLSRVSLRPRGRGPTGTWATTSALAGSTKTTSPPASALTMRRGFARAALDAVIPIAKHATQRTVARMRRRYDIFGRK